MTKIRFFKYEGLGNDFIILPQPPNLARDQIIKLCDRHHGIGADGLIFVFFFEGYWTQRVYNADASMAEMCGNGIRCVAQWLLDHGHPVTHIQTDAGIKTCIQEDDLWSVDMGIAELEGNRISMGNPHLVLLGPVELEKIDRTVNTEFVELIDATEISVRVFERGVGETLACGTGACASVAMLVSRKQLPTNQEITVHLKGGNLYIIARPTTEGLRITMKGPARYVFEGEVLLG